jgi:hypothetical protein
MNTLTFTAGPWRRVGHRTIAAGAGLDTVTICEVFSGGAGIEQADANEALIAAAPELFTALRDIVLETMDCPPVRPFSAASYLPQHLLDAAQRAIAAAEGRHVAGRAGA